MSNIKNGTRKEEQRVSQNERVVSLGTCSPKIHQNHINTHTHIQTDTHTHIQTDTQTLPMFPYLPKELVHIILDYYGKIKYRRGSAHLSRVYRKGEYINIIHKYDARYDVVRPVLQKKVEIMERTERRGETGFYFEVLFEYAPYALCYDYQFLYSDDIFEICYVSLEYGSMLEQIRTQI